MEIKDELMKYLAAGNTAEDIAEMLAETLTAAETEYKKTQEKNKRAAYADAIVVAINDYLTEFHPGHDFGELTADNVVEIIDQTMTVYGKLKNCTFPLRVKPEKHNDADAAIKNFLAGLGL